LVDGCRKFCPDHLFSPFLTTNKKVGFSSHFALEQTFDYKTNFNTFCFLKSSFWCEMKGWHIL